METTSTFSRVIILLLMSIVCSMHDSNAQIRPIRGKLFSHPIVVGGIATADRSVHAQQTELVRRLTAEMMSRQLAWERQQKEMMRHIQQRHEWKSQFLKTPQPLWQTLRLSKENLESSYKTANYLISKGDTIKGIEKLQFVANSGLKEAQYDLGYYYVHGMYTKKNVSVGNQLIQKAAKQNHPVALYYLGEAYYYGYEGFHKDSIESLKWFEKSAEEDFFYGQATTGDFYFNAGDTLKAIHYWQMAHSKDYNSLSEDAGEIWGQATYNLGYFFSNGICVPHDEKTAITYYKEAAKAGHAYSNYYLGVLYQEGGDFTPQNDTIARKYYGKAALGGDVDGQAKYGDCCMLGYGMERDSVSAVFWYRTAAENGHHGAMYILPFYYSDAEDYERVIEWGIRPEISDSSDVQYMLGTAYYNMEDYDNAEFWWKKADAQNVPEAAWMLYLLNSEGDSITALKYLEKACLLEYPEALCDMGFNSLLGYMVERNIEKGRELLQKAASKGCGLAYHNLGCSYSSKEYNGKEDWVTACEYYRKGAELNCPEAQYNYGCCLKKGKGIKKDKQTAIHWFTLSAQNGNEDALAELKKMKVDVSF